MKIPIKLIVWLLVGFIFGIYLGRNIFLFIHYIGPYLTTEGVTRFFEWTVKYISLPATLFIAVWTLWTWRIGWLLPREQRYHDELLSALNLQHKMFSTYHRLVFHLQNFKEQRDFRIAVNEWDLILGDADLRSRFDKFDFTGYIYDSVYGKQHASNVQDFITKANTQIQGIYTCVPVVIEEIRKYHSYPLKDISLAQAIDKEVAHYSCTKILAGIVALKNVTQLLIARREKMYTNPFLPNFVWNIYTYFQMKNFIVRLNKTVF